MSVGSKYMPLHFAELVLQSIFIPIAKLRLLQQGLSDHTAPQGGIAQPLCPGCSHAAKTGRRLCGQMVPLIVFSQEAGEVH